jgi:deoxyribodipyrimidine photolyase-related protein
MESSARNQIGIVFPHQLFENNILISHCHTIYLVEERLFFNQYNFHKSKLIFHRASMKFYEAYLLSLKINVVYIDAHNDLSDIRKLIPFLKSEGHLEFEYVDTTDNWLEKRIAQTCSTENIVCNRNTTPLFLNTSNDNFEFFKNRKRMFQTDFYKHQRISRNVLIENGKDPVGGKWTFDDENRLKYPKGKTPPKIEALKENAFYSEAVGYINQHFPDNYGAVNPKLIYPTTFEESKSWLVDFLENRFLEFGAYEDAIVVNEIILHHSVLTPMLNVGLLTPEFILNETIQFAKSHDIPMNSFEGFIRQIMGWREFIRAVYELRGIEERNKNYWKFSRKIPASFWNGTTGIEPIDLTIKTVLETGYCHHIERLMVFGNFMLLCEFHPDEVYRWFMEMFIDSYDWVMVPNLYGMSQFADGGIMSTKPYISGSNYLMKMSNYPKGEWQQVWDGLFWRFMHVHRDFFLQNPRLGMLVKTFDKMDEAKQSLHLDNAERYLRELDKQDN